MNRLDHAGTLQAINRTVNPWESIGRELPWVIFLFSIYFAIYFSPALLQGRLLAPGDGAIYYLPALLSPAAWWNHGLYAGHPAFADPQALVFSPLRLLGSDYNLAVISIYVIASTGMYCLVRGLTGLPIAGVFCALVYGSGGAMVAHLGHLSIIYTAAWIPWILASIARARSSGPRWAIVLGAIGIGLATLGGHPQILVYGLLLAALYSIFSLLIVR